MWKLRLQIYSVSQCLINNRIRCASIVVMMVFFYAVFYCTSIYVVVCIAGYSPGVLIVHTYILLCLLHIYLIDRKSNLLLL
jgi:hypothetical protein